MLFAPLVAGCDDAPDKPENPGEAAMVSNDLLQFDYKYPAKYDEIEDVQNWLRADKKMSYEDYMKKAEEGKSDNEINNIPFKQHVFTKKWDVTADTAGLYAITSETYNMMGGANGQTTHDTLVWSKAEQKFLITPQIFEKPLEFIDMIRPAFCEGLEEQRAEKRIGTEATKTDAPTPKEDEEDPFETCPALGQFAIIPFAGGQTITGFNVYVPAGKAGPMSEGTYIIHLIVTEDIINNARAIYISDFK